MINSNIQKAILFIDAKIADYQTLAAGVEAGTEVIILDATKDGISQITEELANRHAISGVHIVSHGAPGCVYLGNAQLSLDTLSKYAQQLKQWFVAGESASPSLFLYGCQVAAGDAGTEFLAKLRTLTGANIAASANLTGNAALGGNWELEVALGEGNFASAFTPEMMANYASVLLISSSLSEVEKSLADAKVSISATAKKAIQDILDTLKPLTFEIQADSITATYNGAGSLADILKSVGVSTTTASPILTGSINNPSLTIGPLNTDKPTYKFTGTVSEKQVEFGVTKDNVTAKYTGDISLADLLKTVGVTDTQGSAILTGSITAPTLTVDTSKPNSAYKFSGKISGQDVTFEYQKGQALKVAYTGDISLADLLKTVGVTDTQGSAILTGSITAPSLTVDTSKPNSAYSFSGAISGKTVTFDYQKGQALKVTYTGDVSLADLLKTVGVTDTQGSAILTGSITAPSLTVDISQPNSAYSFSGAISGKTVTFDYQKGQALKVTYTGDVSLADLLKTVGVTDTQGSAILTGSITAPSLTVDTSKPTTAYSFSGKISGQEVKFEYQKGQELKVAYTGDISLADLLKKVGITVESNIAILNKSISDASLTISNLSGKTTSYKLTGKISGEKIDLDFSKQQIKITYQGETSLVDILKGVPGVETIATALSVPITNPSFGIGQLDTPNKTYEISGIANFNKSTEGIGKFINDKLGFPQLDLTTKVDSNGASLKGNFKTDISLFGDKNSQTDFSATLTGAALGLGVDKKAKPSLSIKGNILLKNYDPFQKNEPPLTLSGGLILDPKSLTASFELGLDTPWKTPFGLSNSEVRGLSFQLGGTYVVPYIDNIGLLADIKVGGLDVKSVLFIAPKEPDKFGMELTVYQPIGLVDILSVPLSVAGVDNSAFVGKTKKFLKEVLDVTIVSIDGPDEGTEIDPFLKFVPVTTTFGKTTLTQGIEVNGKINLWGKEATINLAANPFSTDPSLSATLKIPEIDLGFLKITSGKNSTGKDSTLGVDLKLNSKEQSLKADAALEIFGKKLASFDLSLSPKEISLKNFQLGFSDVLAIKLDEFTLNPSNLSGSAKGGIKLFGQDLASASFSLNNGNLSIAGKLGFEILGYDVGVGVNINLGNNKNIIELTAKAGDILNEKLSFDINELSKNITSVYDWAQNLVLNKIAGVFNDGIKLISEGWNSVTAGVASAWNDVANAFTNTARDFAQSIGLLSKNEDIWLDDKNNFYDGKDGNDYIRGNGGDDWLVGGSGTDLLEGGSGNDRLEGNTESDRLSGDQGNDLLEGGEDYDELYGGDGNDILKGGDELVVGSYFKGGDRLYGDKGNDKINGGKGDDLLDGGDNIDFLYGDEDNDSLYGGKGEDLLDGGPGNDYLAGWEGNDRLYGYTGDDKLLGEDGNDELHGWIGNDTLEGQAGNDILYGQQDNDFLYGGDGNDFLDGGDGNDLLDGGDGNDLLKGGLGNDSLYGFTGNDILDGEDGNDELHGWIGEDILKGGSGNDILYGQQDNDILNGGDGNDILYGSIGNDILDGGDGNDLLEGGFGNDLLKGGLGNDSIDGGEGDDTLILAGFEKDYTLTQTATGWKITGKSGEKIVTGVEKFEFEKVTPPTAVGNAVNPVSTPVSTEVGNVVNPVSTAVSNPGKAAGSLLGSISNGPLAGATVFVDTNGNFKPDEDELQTTTDNNGEYYFDESKIAALDINQDGKIDSKEGQIVGIGGIDTTTGLPATLPLISQVGSGTEATTTTPLTTLQAVLSSQGIAAEQVETLLEKISGLPLASLTEPLDNFDPYAAIGKDDTTGINIASGHIKVMNLLLNGTAFLKAAKYQGSDSEIQVIVALGEVLQKVDTFDLSKGDDLQKLFTQLTEKHNLSIASEPVKAVAELVAQSNHLVDDLVTQALTRSVSDVLPSISPIKKAVYSTLPEVTQQLIEGKITAQESQTKLQELLKADTFLVQYALNEKRTVKVTASPTITEGDSNSQGKFTIALGEAAPAQGLKILYTLSGTASLGQDYSTKSGLFGEINIAPGETEAVIDLSVLDDTLPEKPEALTLNLKYVGTGYALDPVYQTAVLKIADNDQQNSANSQNGTPQTGTFGNDTLTGTEGDDNLSGNEGNDVLQGLAGNDQLTGGASDDSLLGGEGSDKLEGNFGADILQGNAGDDAIAGGAENDTLEGNEGNDQLQGNAGDDQLKGNTGNDVLEGGLGNDTLEGNEGNDWLVGDAGQDILTGGAGVDLLNGGDGADVFYFNAPSDGGDLILDFDPTQGDKIQISAAGFNTKSLADFSVLAGTLEFKGQEIALIQNNGQTYNNFPNLGEILEIVDAPTAQPAPTAGEISAQTSPSVANSDLVKKPQTTILDDVIKRGKIKVGTSDLGAEFDFEFSRTLAAALFGDASKVEKLKTKDEALKMVADGTVDVASQRTTHTLGRDATLNIDFSSLYFYDRQAVMVRQNSGIETVLDLKGRTIGILEGSTSLGNLQNELSPQGVEFISKSFANIEEAMAAYDREEIDAFSIDSSIITERLKNLSNPQNHRLLDVEFSKEPIAIILPENDSQWADVVRWVNNVPIQAEDFGISSQNIDEIIAANTDKNPNNDYRPAIRRFLGLEDDLGGSLGLPKDFAVNVIKQVGNYGEIYDRHFPGVERDRNLLWNEGGLLYSPPFSGTKVDATLIDNDDRNVLSDVLKRGVVKVGVNGEALGFSHPQADGKLAGFDVDLGHAIAAALFGNPDAVELVTQNNLERFTNVANGIVDVSASQATVNLVRDASLGIDYSPTYLYTGQGVLVRDNSGISSLAMLNGRKVGLLENTTSQQNLQDALSELGGTFIPVMFPTKEEMFAAYDRGEVDAISNDLPLLSATIPTLSNPEQHQILDEVLSKEPLAIVVDENQSEWADVVRWVYNALVQAEEYGITSGNIEELIAQNTDDNPANNSYSEIRQFLGLEGNIGEALGLPKDFAVKAIEAVGNYGEMYDRHFNSNVLRRDSNALAADFGLQYSPPFTGTTVNNTVTGTEGNDLLNGNSGDNSLNGNQGNDTLSGGQGNDTLWGGKGHDFVSGGKGNDILNGGKGTDTLNGDAGDDLLNGGKGNDILFGGKGNDILNGGAGDDLLNGGKGRDTFVLTPGNGTDTIADFTIGQDLLELAGGLKFEQLTITQGTGTQSRDTLIRLVSTGAVLASLTDSSASSITPAMFTLN